jgi:radical SAM enzyme (TIGR01210 family)
MKIVDKYEMSYVRKMGNPITHKTENELIVLLPVGCYWAKKTGGCSYCGYQSLVDEMLSSCDNMSYLDILRNEISKQTETVHRLSFFVGGSFFEIPRDERILLFTELTKYPDIREVYIESRPELITENNVTELRNIIPNKILNVAIGMESSDDYIRNKIHNKGASDDILKRAFNILKNSGSKIMIYVFVKPPVANITDQEAFEDAYNSTKYSFENGADIVELECGYVVENSKMYDLYIKGKYEPLKLYTIKDLILAALKLKQGIVRLAYFSDNPEPIAVPKNCDLCTDKYLEMFDEYRKTLNPTILERTINCRCHENSDIIQRK